MEQKVNISRPITIAVVSILFLVSGVSWLVGGGLIATLGLTFSQESSLSRQLRMDVVLGALGCMMIVIGAVDLAVGYGLRKMKRWATIIGMLLCVFAISLSSLTQSIGTMSMYSGGYPVINILYLIGSLASADIWINALLFVALAMSWKAFEQAT